MLYEIRDLWRFSDSQARSHRRFAALRLASGSTGRRLYLGAKDRFGALSPKASGSGVYVGFVTQILHDGSGGGAEFAAVAVPRRDDAIRVAGDGELSVVVSSVIVIAQIDHPLGIGESIGALFEEVVCLGSCRSRGNGERDAARWRHRARLAGGGLARWRHRARLAPPCGTVAHIVAPWCQPCRSLPRCGLQLLRCVDRFSGERGDHFKSGMGRMNVVTVELVGEFTLCVDDSCEITESSSRRRNRERLGWCRDHRST